ncbi:hypothetical protein AWC19_04300 [Mycobacterium palustre]|uniref:Amine oxidase domain-containing protein n=1 Tax=Mycobacterium palustre TaxID=153971 RepID=A0A1X1ZST5_9MYCO|nr:hypothetical protein AWC19_04300 [Mycobacterium palustre]
MGGGLAAACATGHPPTPGTKSVLVPRLLAGGLKIVLGTRVTAAGSRSFEGAAAIVTVPLGVLKSGAVAFDPPLPDGHTRAVNALGFGALSKGFFRFARRTWNVDNAFYQFLGTAPGVWSQWFALPSAAGPVVLAFNAGERGRSAESSAPGDLMAAAPSPGDSSATTTAPSMSSTSAPRSGLSTPTRAAPTRCTRPDPATVTGAVVSGRDAAGRLTHRLSG